MLKNRKFKMFGVIVLILAAILVTISAVNIPSPASEDLSESSKGDISDPNEQAVVPVTGHEDEAAPALELPARTNFTAEIKEELRSGNQTDAVENSYAASEEDGNMAGPYEFKILQWENTQNGQ